MKCEEFEAMGLDGGRDASRSESERTAAAQHVNSCARCAALQSSWEHAATELRAFAEESAEVQAPARVEMRLRQEFRTQHKTLRIRRTAVAAVWALAAAVVVIGAVGWVKWHDSRQVARGNAPNPVTIHEPSQQPTVLPPIKEPETVIPNSQGPDSQTPVQNAAAPRRKGAAKKPGSEVLVADNAWSGFTLLPGVLPMDSDYGEILRVRMQRGALASFGLPVNEERASDWIQVDLLVGDDGSPQAVRLPRQQ
jgi:hypothetical protein